MWLIPVTCLLAAWAVIPPALDVPAYKLPRLDGTLDRLWQITSDGTLAEAIGNSLLRLGEGFLIGAGLGLTVGLLMATNAKVTAFVEPVVAFFQAVAGIAWIPLAIVWFGFGSGPVLFVVANAIFFIVLYNTILGVESIQPVLINALRTLGGTKRDVMREVIVPGALVSVLTGLRSGLAFGWRALIAVELIANSPGLGFLSRQAEGARDGETIIIVVLVVGALWLAMDSLILGPLQERTVVRWGMVASGRRA
ncbi:putative Binding-protein-dependent transport systems inner membrane component (Precursor) [Streptomyces viridochromogenes Tue57]|uniref:Putative Binding-protein-dependent transport systems inner membrane component (Precursor) n=2 Tax=Streptomyces viridochromogenes TaxID=1938 RepID=L8PP17_STRVR|nr:putative Binding-protein-dependent transport systems inner membrane component (Precursor) [Streptomyces viridochromogenes Tue57]